MTRQTRKTARVQMGAVLNTALTGDGNPVQAVYDHLKEDFQGQSPVVVVASAGTRPLPQSHTHWRAEYNLEIIIFAVRENEEVAEDALDDVAEALFAALETNRTTDYWRDLTFGTPSDVLPATVGGEPYWMEPLTVTVHSY
jgi:hypothetical protein